jgi:hypothetical protein
MKLARAHLSIVHIGSIDHTGQSWGQPGSSTLLQSISACPRRISRPSGELAARWHVSPETGRIECRWMLDQPPADDYLCAGYMTAKRRQRPASLRSSLPRPILADCTNLSENP